MIKKKISKRGKEEWLVTQDTLIVNEGDEVLTIRDDLIFEDSTFLETNTQWAKVQKVH